MTHNAVERLLCEAITALFCQHFKESPLLFGNTNILAKYSNQMTKHPNIYSSEQPLNLTPIIKLQLDFDILNCYN